MDWLKRKKNQHEEKKYELIRLAHQTWDSCHESLITT